MSCPATTIGDAALWVLATADPLLKAAASKTAASAWRSGGLMHRFPSPPPDRPGRPDRPELLPPNKMAKRGKAGSSQGRFALLHALAHIELNAIDLAWDLLARFGQNLPASFVDDWVKVGDEEALHFELLAARLSDLGGAYGDLPAHDGLWDSAMATHHDLAGRLAVVPLVLEARGLDVTPQTIERFLRAGDEESSRILKIIYDDEIGHVATGQRWFQWCCESLDTDPKRLFHDSVKKYFKGNIKPPFNDSARLAAGMPSDFYLPLAEM